MGRLDKSIKTELCIHYDVVDLKPVCKAQETTQTWQKKRVFVRMAGLRCHSSKDNSCKCYEPEYWKE
jgi:hypothetical protein